MFWHIWRHNWRHNWRQFMYDLMENTNFERFINQRTTIYRFYRFYHRNNRFFVILMIWRSFDTYHAIIDDIWHHNWRNFMSDLMENAKFKHFTAQITTIYQFYRFTIEIIDFFVVNLIIWRSFDTYHVIIDVIIDVNLYPIWWKTQTLDIFIDQRTTIYRIYRF